MMKPRLRCALAAVFAAWLCASPSAAQSPAGRDQAASSNDAQGEFDVQSTAGFITSLRRTHDAVDTQYVARGARLGDVLLAYRAKGSEAWQSANTASLTPMDADAAAADSSSTDARQFLAKFHIANEADVATSLALETGFRIEANAIVWTIAVKNLSPTPVEIGDLALPFPMNSAFGRGPATSAAMKHSFVSGHGSFLFWMRPGGVGPYLMLTPLPNTKLEYWEPPQRGPGGPRRQSYAPAAAYRAFIHSAASGAVAADRRCNWRQAHTSLTLAPAGNAGDQVDYAFKFRWAKDLDDVRQILVDERLVDVQVMPGMTIPSDLTARVALRSKEAIHAVEAEFPDQTDIEPLGRRGDYQIYSIRFRRLGENRLTIRFGDDRQTYLEFFSAEPVETLIKKRAAFLARSQHHDPSKWYRGLISDWNMETGVLLGPDNYDRIEGFRIYEVSCDDPGLAKPAFLAAKNAEFPNAREVEALDDYIEHFVWGGLQRTTEESYPYGIYGIQDWKRNRESSDPGRNGQLHIWRCYDYPHIVLLYHSMYRVAKNSPQIPTRLSAEEYLRRAAGTAIALFTVPREVEGWAAYRTGFYNELVIVDLIGDLEASSMQAEADALRQHWERKVRFFVADKPDLFRSEYAFDSTGFESTHALAKYAMDHADDARGASMGITPDEALRFLEAQMAANVFCRGTMEPAYYYLGSDYRGGGGNGYTLSYMSMMGGWSVLDYALNFAKEKRAEFLRLGYASILSAWALVNSGTPDSNYGYWYPGAGNDGAAGGGFEPAPYGRTWLGQPHHRGAWYYACESDLGFSGALRAAATVVADDPIFGRVCFGGDMTADSDQIKVVPKDGLRRRFHAMTDVGKVQVVLDGGRFAAGAPIVLRSDLRSITAAIESDNPAEHAMKVELAGDAGRYAIAVNGANAEEVATDGRHTMTINVKLPADARRVPMIITKLESSESP